MLSAEYLVISDVSDELAEDIVATVLECDLQNLEHARSLFVTSAAAPQRSEGVSQADVVDLGDLLVPATAAGLGPPKSPVVNEPALFTEKKVGPAQLGHIETCPTLILDTCFPRMTWP